MGSRKQCKNRILRHYVKQQPGYVREFAYDEDGKKVMDETGQQRYRDRPNRAAKRMVLAMARRGK